VLSGVTDDELAGVLRKSERQDKPGARIVAKPRGAVWVTRANVFVDRMASAWLIRRFIDPQAKFKFVSARSRKIEGALRFDMYKGEFTHVGDRCTFETLLHHFKLSDPGLRAIGEVVHDIDLKDGKFGRPEAAGLATLLRGVTRSTSDDMERIRRGISIFNDLLASLRTGRA
jgi:hypothetical protein